MTNSGTDTCDGKWSIHNLSHQQLDLLLWDYSNNDYPNNRHHCLFDGFFEQSLLAQPNLAAFGLVFGVENLDPMIENCNSNNSFHPKYTNDLATLDSPLLKQIFDPRIPGKFSNLTLLTMSIGSFCDPLLNNAFCSPNEFLNSYNLHTSDQGMSIFSDLFIYQLLKPFDNILSSYCQKDESSKLFEDSTTQNERNNMGMSSKYWYLDANLQYREKEIISASSPIKKYFDLINDLINTNKYILPRWKIIASLLMSSPQIVGPLHKSHFSIICFPPDRQTKMETSMNVFNITDKFAMTVENVETYFIVADIVQMMIAGCAGWNIFGDRYINRPDDNHDYTLTATPECTSGNVTISIILFTNTYLIRIMLGSAQFKTSCPIPETWSKSRTYPKYPHLTIDYFSPLPIKPVDIVFKINVELDWYQACFISCAPTLIYKKFRKDIWSTYKLKTTEVNETPNEFSDWTKCYKRDSDFKALFSSYTLFRDEYYLVYSGDECYPLDYSRESWGQRNAENFYLLSNVLS